MNDTLRYVVAGILIFLIILLQPLYLEWLGYGPENIKTSNSPTVIDPVLADNAKKNLLIDANNVGLYEADLPGESFITISSELYTLTLSNRSGGSFVNYLIKGNDSEKLRYMGGYDDDGYFDPDIPVSLIMPLDFRCNPCIASYDDRREHYVYYNHPFNLVNAPRSDTLFLDVDDQVELTYQMVGEGNKVLITSSIVFYGNSYISDHMFSFNGIDHDISENIELIWRGGLRPTEESVEEDVQYGSGIFSQSGEVDDMQVKSVDKNVEREVYKGQTDWVAIRTKYFISALLVENPGSYAVLSAKNAVFGDRKQTPLYSSGIGFPSDTPLISSRIYFGPLDVDHISEVGLGLDATMNWGFSIIRPISKSVLWILKFMHRTFNLNYGIVLLLFAVLIRFVSGPLTKKSFESSQNLQKIQPELKSIQAKYKGDPQGLNRETMALYKKYKVNPLGGCLPILIQMPLLWALFIVFRTTIEFRGAPFFFWITDLSKPDVVFYLPFSIPIYGNGVAILPLLMGVTLILTMRMTSATMDKSQKPVMYFMNVFFVLLFNTFPSGLNLYYTAYNILSFFQQRSIRAKINN